MSKAGVSADRVNYILESKEEEDIPDAQTPPMNGDIRFEHISFSYEGTQPILKNVDFTIRAGTTFAILGGTGSGKSTLMHLLNRSDDLPPECGRITVGGNRYCRDETKLGAGKCRYGPPGTLSVLQNDTGKHQRLPSPGLYGGNSRVAGIACVDEAIEGFTEGYETIVGERGVTLSGGQKQRVAIARMLMQRAPIMVFDDSLSAVDSETDAKIRKALKHSLGSSTVILISHRITTLMQADPDPCPGGRRDCRNGHP